MIFGVRVIIFNPWVRGFIKFNINWTIKLSGMQSRKAEGRSLLQGHSLSQRTTLRFATLNTDANPFLSENNSPTADSFRQQRLPKFKTQENSPIAKKKGSTPKFHFPDLYARQNNPSQYTLHSLNVEEIKSKVAKTSLLLDSIIKIFKEEELQPTNRAPEPNRRPVEPIRRAQADDFNEFLEPAREKRSKRPKIIQNQMTRIFLSSKEKERKTKATSIHTALAEKIDSNSYRNGTHNPSRIANEFLPEGKEELNKLRTLRFSKN